MLYEAQVAAGGHCISGGEDETDGDNDNDEEVDDGEGLTSYGMHGADCHP
jgi:hypothetical protein